jgi:hypothetical protein
MRGCQPVSSVSVSTRADEGMDQGNERYRGLGTTSSDASKRLSKKKPVDFKLVSLQALIPYTTTVESATMPEIGRQISRYYLMLKTETRLSIVKLRKASL